MANEEEYDSEKYLYATILIFIVGILMLCANKGCGTEPEPLEINPEGTWSVYHRDSNLPSYTLVVKPMKRGWAVTWVVCDGVSPIWDGILQRGSQPNTFVEFWHERGKNHTHQFLWLWPQQVGGAVISGTNLYIRK